MKNDFISLATLSSLLKLSLLLILPYFSLFYLKENYRKIKEMSLFRYLKKEVETGASGTQSYVIKKGPNKDKIAK